MIGVIIQARMNSSRLKGKVLKKIGDKNLIEQILHRLGFLKTQVKIIVATSTNPENKEIEKLCLSNNISCYRGSEDNVLERYYLSAQKYSLKHIIRLTADNPFTDIEELDNLIELHLNQMNDYTHSFEVLPKGVGAEIFTFNALKKSYIEGKEPHHIEHVNEYMIENPQLFKTGRLQVDKSKQRKDISLTVDTINDYERALFVVNEVKNKILNTVELIKAVERSEEIF